MPIAAEHAFKEKSAKLWILLPLTTIKIRTFQCETPCTMPSLWCKYFAKCALLMPLFSGFSLFGWLACFPADSSLTPHVASIWYRGLCQYQLIIHSKSAKQVKFLKGTLSAISTLRIWVWFILRKPSLLIKTEL